MMYKSQNIDPFFVVQGHYAQQFMHMNVYCI